VQEQGPVIRELSRDLSDAWHDAIEYASRLGHVKERKLLQKQAIEQLRGYNFDHEEPKSDGAIPTTVSSSSPAILFADLEGSSRSTDPPSAQAINAIRDIFRAAVLDRGAREVRFLGDGLLAEFDYPYKAIESAIAIVKQISEYSKAATEPLLARVALASRVTEAIRIAAHASRGEVLVSDSIQRLVGPSFAFVDRRNIELAPSEPPTSIYSIRPAK